MEGTLDKQKIQEKYDITAKQLDNWFKLGIERNFLIKKTKPVRYYLNADLKLQILFSEN